MSGYSIAPAGRCYHCAGPLEASAAEDSRDAGIRRVILCGDCVDILVWGGACGSCDRQDLAHRRCDGSCACTAATINAYHHSREAVR
jgi:hypothetical protein